MIIQGHELGLTFDHFLVTLDTATGIAHIIINRPDKLNAFLLEMRSQFAHIFTVLERNEHTRVIIIRGVGDRAFTAGGDIGGFLEADSAALSYLHEHIAAPERFPGPVIAAIDGYCFGVGLEIALACDFRIATTRAIFALPELRLGMIPGSGGTQRLARLVGLGRAKDMIMRGRHIRAEEAFSWGLITQVVSPDELDQAAEALATELLDLPTLALSVAKRVINLSQDLPLSAGLQLEGYAYGMLRSTPDFTEGVQAFLEKRPPYFIHRNKQ